MLRVSRLTDYATVVMAVMAAAPAEVQSAPGVAEQAGLEATTVAKVLKPLAQAGLLEGFRGANGGYRLARGVDDITLADIVEAMEGPLAMTECSVHDDACSLTSQCNVRGNWQRINGIIADALREVTLAGLLAPATTHRRRIPMMVVTNTEVTHDR